MSKTITSAAESVNWLLLAYSGLDVQAKMNRQMGMQMLPICPGRMRASGWTLFSDFAARGWYTKYSQRRYVMTETTAPTNIPKKATKKSISTWLVKSIRNQEHERA